MEFLGCVTSVSSLLDPPSVFCKRTRGQIAYGGLKSVRELHKVVNLSLKVVHRKGFAKTYSTNVVEGA